MEIVADLHLHSRHSRAVSKNMTLPVMSQYAKQKGIDLLTAADWTHPVWMKEMKTLLEETGEGVYTLKISNDQYPNSNEPRFILSTEIASIYKQGDKLRRIHNLVFVPNIATAEEITDALVKRGCNLNADGRPIVGLSSKNLLELILSIDEKCFLIPCHVWTPHFGIYGSASGFDSLEEAFGESASQIYGIETGLSSDPDMNWSMEELRDRSILSFSDAHSPAKMAREATVFQLESVTYEAVRQAIMQPMLRGKEIKRQEVDGGFPLLLGEGQGEVSPTTKPRTSNRVSYTIEFYPEEGKYHFSGHRNCKISYGPEEIAEKGNICPVCRQRMTEGVLYRVQQLSSRRHSGDDEGGRQNLKSWHAQDRDAGQASMTFQAVPKTNSTGLQWFTDPDRHHPPYVKLVPLLETIAESIGSTVSSQKSQQIYDKLCNELVSELHVILKAPIEDIRRIAGEKVSEGIQKVRGGNIVIIPGYDGEYGKVEIWEEGSKSKNGGTTHSSSGQLGLGI